MLEPKNTTEKDNFFEKHYRDGYNNAGPKLIDLFVKAGCIGMGAVPMALFAQGNDPAVVYTGVALGGLLGGTVAASLKLFAGGEIWEQKSGDNNNVHLVTPAVLGLGATLAAGLAGMPEDKLMLTFAATTALAAAPSILKCFGIAGRCVDNAIDGVRNILHPANDKQASTAGLAL